MIYYYYYYNTPLYRVLDTHWNKTNGCWYNPWRCVDNYIHISYLSLHLKQVSCKTTMTGLGSRLTRLLDNTEEKFSYGKTTIPELTVS